VEARKKEARKVQPEVKPQSRAVEEKERNLPRLKGEKREKRKEAPKEQRPREVQRAVSPPKKKVEKPPRWTPLNPR